MSTMTIQEIIQDLKIELTNAAIASNWEQVDKTKLLIDRLQESIHEIALEQFNKGHEEGFAAGEDQAIDDSWEEGRNQGYQEGELVGILGALEVGYYVGHEFGLLDSKKADAPK